MSEGKRRFKDRMIDKVPVVGQVRRGTVWLKAHRGWFYLAIAVGVIFVVRPALTIVAGVFGILKGPITALLDNPVGRFVFYNVLAIALGYWVWRKSRGGVLRIAGLFAMRRFIDGLNLMILGRWSDAIEKFEKVERIGRWADLEEVIPEHRDILRDTRLKIATCYHRMGDANQALRWHKRVPADKILSAHVRRHHAELHALIYDISDELEEETILSELEKSAGVGKRGSRRVLRALIGRVEATGDLEKTRGLVKRLVDASDDADKETARRHLARLEFRLAHKALGDGSPKSSLRNLKVALKVDPGDFRSALLLGDLALEKDDVPGALKAWSRAVSLPVFDRIAKLLESGRLDGDHERKLLLAHFPYAGTMLVLAERHRKRGEFRQAKAALEKVREQTGESFLLLREYAACLEGEGDTEGAAGLYRRALAQSFG